MQIYLKWTCRECGQDQETRTDTANYGLLSGMEGDPPNDARDGFVNNALVVALYCRNCVHVSGNVGLGYEYKAEHRSRQERAEKASS
jgi:hypothetical protein